MVADAETSVNCYTQNRSRREVQTRVNDAHLIRIHAVYRCLALVASFRHSQNVLPETGQEAPVVFYSMATSTPEGALRGMEFLYTLNLLNLRSPVLDAWL
jgi:hypothetical protein